MAALILHVASILLGSMGHFTNFTIIKISSTLSIKNIYRMNDWIYDAEKLATSRFSV